MFAKLYSSMYDGTLATNGPWEALVTFQQLLILCDRTGMVDMTMETISRRTTIPVDIIRKGIAALEAPDPGSRRREEEGRRLVRLDQHRDWGWQIVNYEHYRNIRNADERREYMRGYMRERRAGENKPATRKAPARVNGSFATFWNAYPRKESRIEAEKAWSKINPDEGLQGEILAAIERQKRDGCLVARATQDGRSTIPHPSTWLNGQRWKDEAGGVEGNPLYAGPGKAVM